MPTFIYTDDIPFPDHNPSTDQPDMLINTNSVDGIIGVDHFTFEQDNFDGYHRVIHQPTGALTQNVTRSGIGAVYANLPANIANINQIFAGTYTPDTTGAVADTQFFSETGSGIISQLTGLKTQAGNQLDGWAWVGGILIQWGIVNTALATGMVTYKDRFAGAIPFPNFCFNVQASLQTTGAPSTTAGCIAIKTGGGFSKDSFNWNATNITSFNGFFWMAIGN